MIITTNAKPTQTTVSSFQKRAMTIAINGMSQLATQSKNRKLATARARWIMAGIVGMQDADCKVREVLAAPNQLPAGSILLSRAFRPSLDLHSGGNEGSERKETLTIGFLKFRAYKVRPSLQGTLLGSPFEAQQRLGRFFNATLPNVHGKSRVARLSCLRPDREALSQGLIGRRGCHDFSLSHVQRPTRSGRISKKESGISPNLLESPTGSVGESSAKSKLRALPIGEFQFKEYHH